MTIFFIIFTEVIIVAHFIDALLFLLLCLWSSVGGAVVLGRMLF